MTCRGICLSVSRVAGQA